MIHLFSRITEALRGKIVGSCGLSFFSFPLLRYARWATFGNSKLMIVVDLVGFIITTPVFDNLNTVRAGEPKLQ